MKKQNPNIKLLAVGFTILITLFLLPGLGWAQGDVTAPGDPIVGFGGTWPEPGETPAKAIDNDAGSKYLNFGKLNTGFTVTPAVGGTRITGINLTSGGDAPERDPASYAVYGSTDGTQFALIAAGNVPPFSGRGVKQSLAFATASSGIFTSYKVIIPTVLNAGAANSMQVAEVELPGTAETSDTWAPFVTKVTGSSLTSITLNFSEVVDLSAATFDVSGGATATAAAGADASIVVLTTSPLIAGNTYTVTINGVKDAANNVIAENSTVQVFADTGVRMNNLYLDRGVAANFQGRNAAGNAPVGGPSATDLVGAVARSNWFNIDNYAVGTDTETAALTDHTGAATPVTVQFIADDSWNADGAENTPNEKMMKGIIKAGGTPSSMYAAFKQVPMGAYHLLTYHAVNNGPVPLNMTANGLTYYVTEPNQFGGTFIKASSTNPSARDAGNYVQWDGVIPGGGGIVSFTMKHPSGGDGGGLSGMQLIPQPVGVAGVNLASFRLVFSDPITDASAAPENITISGGVTVLGATLSADFQTIIVDTDAMIKGNTYWVSVNNILKRSDASAYVPNGAMGSFVARPPADIALNFAGGQGNNGGNPPTTLAATDVAGVAPSRNWNNILNNDDTVRPHGANIPHE